MADHVIEVSATAERQLRSLPKPDQVRIVRTIRKLAIEPRSRGCRKLRGYNDVYRIRSGRFRVIYSIEDARLIIIILKIGHRKSVYRGQTTP